MSAAIAIPAPASPGGTRGWSRRFRIVCGGLLAGLLVAHAWAEPRRQALVLQTDFGLKDGAVAAMKGVAFGVEASLPIFDLSHENTPYDIWEAAHRLLQAAPYWPEGTVFVSVIDPGVGTERTAVVLRAKSGHLFVTPDNGTLTLVADELGVDEVRRIDERQHRRAGSAESHTFHGRDLFVLAGARLAAGQVRFEQIGPRQERELVRFDYVRARREGDRLVGGVPALDPNFGNVWTNIPRRLLTEWGAVPGDRFEVRIQRGEDTIYHGRLPFVQTFGDVPEGEPLLYLNSLLNLSLAMNMKNFSARYGVGAGAEWTVTIERAAR